ncbi:MAG: VWA domain-containing protein, partial [Lachnospiraceae bacterium]|nr:VWA domain-containing protein [Lachnospiraceae bacterium]
ADELKNIEAPLKHVILLTDGEDGFNDYNDLLADLREDGITLSTVAVGAGANKSLLTRLAGEGGGRSYYSDGDSKLPRIFAQEVYLSAKSYLVNDPFVPAVVNSHEIIKGIFDEGCPSLLGYIASSPKSSSTVILESDKEDPILTVWQYGLGRSAAWNSDGSGEWTGNFSGWDNYAALWRNIIDWSITDTSEGDDSLTIDQDGQKARIRYSTDHYDGTTSVTAMITDEDGKSREITIPASSPGSFEAEVELGEPGIYSINLRNASGDQVIKNINTAAAIQYSREYQYADASDALTGFVEKAGGRYITKAQEVFDTKLEGAVSRQDLTNALLLLAGLLFMLDILIRRLGLNPAGLPAAIRQAARRRAKEREKEKARKAGEDAAESNPASSAAGAVSGTAAGGATGVVSDTAAGGASGAVSGTAAGGASGTGSGTAAGGAAGPAGYGSGAGNGSGMAGRRNAAGYAHENGQKSGVNVDKSSENVDKPGRFKGKPSQISESFTQKNDKRKDKKDQAQVIDTATLLKKKRDRQ